MPYPTPLTNLDAYRDLYKNPNRRRAEFHLIWPTRQPRTDQEILIAGCGTSQAARYALREPNAQITAIDVSDASLRHTRDQRKYNLENLELRRLSIERVRKIGGYSIWWFVRECSATYPIRTMVFARFATSCDPSGAMRLMVYARYGRAGIYMIQEYAACSKSVRRRQIFKSLGDALKTLPPDHPISGLLRRSKDFLRLEAMADALLHPQDRAYTVPEVYPWLDYCGMSFGR